MIGIHQLSLRHAALLFALAVAPSSAYAANVTPDVIFGSGNLNGDFTVGTGGGVELGLRGKLRFDSANQPQNIFNYDGGNTYTFSAGNPSPGFGFAANNPVTPIWNFEWSINSDVATSTGNNLNDLTYLLQLDYDPSAGTNFLASFDPINVPDPASADHAIGTNATANGGGVNVTNNPADRAAYLALIDNNNVAQNSWNYLFFAGLVPPASFDPFAPGVYTINLLAFDNGNEIASTSIDILVTPVPLPAALPLMLTGLAGLGLVARRRRRRATASA